METPLDGRTTQYSAEFLKEFAPEYLAFCLDKGISVYKQDGRRYFGGEYQKALGPDPTPEDVAAVAAYLEMPNDSP